MQTRFLRIVSLSATFAWVAAVHLWAQQPVERPAATGSVPSQPRSFDYTHLKDRPYTFDLPKPQFPSSPRTQREFVVEYLYDYAVSTYTPEVDLPVVPVAQFKRDTPENALIALFSSMRTGDFDSFVQCWEAKDRKELTDDAKAKHQDAAFWRNAWRPAFSRDKRVTLLDRVETASQYVILDVRVAGLSVPSMPNVFKLINGEWLATNELSNDPILFQFRPGLAGSMAYVQPQAVSTLDKDSTLQTGAQQHFLAEHDVRGKVVQAGPTQSRTGK